MISAETPESPPSSQQPTKKSLKTLRYPVELFTTGSAIKQGLEDKAVDTVQIQAIPLKNAARKQTTAERLKKIYFLNVVTEEMLSDFVMVCYNQQKQRHAVCCCFFVQSS